MQREDAAEALGQEGRIGRHAARLEIAEVGIAYDETAEDEEEIDRHVAMRHRGRQVATAILLKSRGEMLQNHGHYRESP